MASHGPRGLARVMSTAMHTRVVMARTSPPRERPHVEAESGEITRRVVSNKTDGTITCDDKDRAAAEDNEARKEATTTQHSTCQVLWSAFSDIKNYVSQTNVKMYNHLPPTHAQVLWTLAFLSGWADILCIQRYFAFATMLTGNSIYAAQSASRSCWCYAP